MLEQGMNKGQVIDHLVQKYGERILAAPAAEGLHLIPWLLPGIVMVLGGVLVAILIYRWVKKKPNDSEEESRSQAFTKEDELKVQEELKNWL
ncbi:cytochrome c-type biogenesis protein CcmH [Halobacillus shinanisalinarum]|uniref:Cytochrome c-type biogenesis protein n=1 Tax=Halobacillus shinanisalinarum TaxID=2932258 RepID=A0ABY4H0Y8_9BACI|nr:cytochrome c-type biogenesis protein CcmH [Halobacillus shinanisalinarum]UOQ93999.1 cytochrome c-type biogenesis protein CcmH [Halobacillus shinanisalinarum]